MHHVTVDRFQHELTAYAQGVGIIFAVKMLLVAVDRHCSCTSCHNTFGLKLHFQSEWAVKVWQQVKGFLSLLQCKL